ncbi:MAG: FAD-binding oxidoreductase [Actinomycetia bacterium]|nr:FAD-binding oxidoreductase [Actinomycetes bacterium]
MSAPTFARWGTPPQPVELAEPAQRFLKDTLGVAEPRAAVELQDLAVSESRLSGEQFAGLMQVLGNAGVSTSAGDRLMHVSGCSLVDYLQLRNGEAAVPDAVVRPESHDSVHELLGFCSNNAIPVVPFGGGTSVVGGLNPDRHGREETPWISISLERMNRLLDIDEISQTATVQPGITGPELEAVLARRGLTLGHIPQSWERASIGGYVATRSAGQTSTGFGRIDDMVEALRVATPVGELELGHGPKSAAGPDLRQLFIGSEGALGIITEITLRLRRTAKVVKYEGFMLPGFGEGVAAFRDLAQTRATADVMRLSDVDETAATMQMSGPQGSTAAVVQRYLNLRGVGDGSLAILGWEGWSRDAVNGRRRAAARILRGHGAVSLGSSVGASWRRHRFDGPYLRDELLDQGYLAETLETACHWRDIPAVYAGVRDALGRSLADRGNAPYVMCHVSHVYQTGGSLYFTVLVRADADPVAQWQMAKRAATDAMVRHGGTITHHHAVGRDHAPWMEAEIGLEGVRLLRSIKACVDPQRVMNPGVLLP